MKISKRQEKTADNPFDANLIKAALKMIHVCDKKEGMKLIEEANN
ncbi:MAG: hypothetical protein R2788_19390 [Saprospiraceae bacterium]